ncbi:MAG: polysaccharide biosynthesis C-terminal domain-containing protein [Patescibacteria group bacterium]
MSSYQKFTKNVFIIGATYVMGALSGMILLPVITKILGPKDYGVWVQLKGTINLIIPFILLGLPSAIVRFLAVEKDKKQIREGVYSVLFLVFFISLIVSLFLVFFAGSVASFFQTSPLLVKILSLVIILECLNLVITDALVAFQELKKYSLLSIFQTVGEILLIIGFVFLGYGLFGAVLSLVFIRLIVFSILFIYIFRRIGIKIPNFFPIKKYLAFSLPTLGAIVSYWVIASSDRYLINLFMGVIFVGYYAPAYAIGSILNFFIYPLTFALSAVLPKLFDEKRIDETKNFLKYSVKYFLLITIPAAFGLSVLSRQLLSIFSTKEIADNAYFVTPFIALSILLYGLSNFFGNNLVLAKKTKILGFIWAVAAAINLVLNIVFIPMFGILAAAITTFLAYLVSFLLIRHFALKEFKFEIDRQFIVKSVIASIIMVLFILWFDPIGFSKTMQAILISVVIYGILILLFKGINKKEIYFFINSSKKI